MDDIADNITAQAKEIENRIADMSSSKERIFMVVALFRVAANLAKETGKSKEHLIKAFIAECGIPIQDILDVATKIYVFGPKKYEIAKS